MAEHVFDEDTSTLVVAAAIANLSAISGGEAPTEAEHNATRTAINSILAALRLANIIAAD